MSRSLLPKHVAAVVKYQKDPLRALQMFNSAKTEDGFKHNLFTYATIIEKLGFHGKFKEMESILAEMRLNIDNSLMEGVYIGAMRNYGKKQKIQEAVDVFERMEFFDCEPSVQSYNAIMNILVEYGYFDQAHKLYMRMKNKGILPDVYTFTIRIKSFCKSGRPYAALRLLVNVPSPGCDLNAVAYCTVIGGFYEENNKSEAYNLFNKMLGLGLFPCITTYNKLIHPLCRKGDVQESEKLLNKVLKRGVYPNLFTFNIFIRGLCNKGMVNEAASLLDRVKKDGFAPDLVTYNTLIYGLCKNSKVVLADFYLRQMVNEGGLEPDAFTYNTIVNGYCTMGMVQNAEKFLKSATFKGFIPDQYTYCSLINGFCQDGDIDRAMEIFNDASQKGLKADIVLYNSLVKGLSQKGLVLQALNLIHEMTKDGCTPNIWTYNLIINGLCKMGYVDDANNLMNDAILIGYLPDIFTFNTLIDGYCKKLKLDTAIEVVDRMTSHGVNPDVITYNSLLNGLCKASKYNEAIETFKSVLEKGCAPNIITYNILLESLCKVKRLKEALDLIVEVESKGLKPDDVTFGTLLNGFCENGDLDGAYNFFRKVEKNYKFSHTAATYNIMITWFSKKLILIMAEKLFHEMAEKGFPPDTYTYRGMIDGFLKTGNVDSAYNFLLDGIEKGFIPSLVTIGRVLNCLCAKHKNFEAVGIVYLMVRQGIVPEIVNTIFGTDKREKAAPKIVVEDFLKKGHITYYAYEVLNDGIRDKKLLKKTFPKKSSPHISTKKSFGVHKSKS